MTSLGLGDISAFPFVDAPDPRQVADGVRLLEELGAFEGERRTGQQLTASGRALARLPVDPRLGRMLIEAGRLGCTREVLVIVAALSMQDPRERPADKQTQADQSHARFRDEHSDFMSLLNLWAYLKDQQKALSHSAFRRMCRAEFLHYLRVREWQDLHAQLRKACQDEGIDPRRATSAPGEAPNADVVHQALLAGLLSHLGVRDEAKRDYLGARGARFAISPGSTLFRRQPAWIMSAELVETTRLWARTNARIDPLWAEQLAGHLVKRTYSEPRWSRRQGAALATERVTLYGVPLVAARTVQYARINPEVSRDLFIRHALVEGDWDTHHEFYRANQALLQRLSELEERARRRDILVDDEDLVAFYDERIPADVVSQRHFDAWWKQARRETPQFLHFTEALLTRESADAVSASDYPRTWRQGGLELPVTYQFEPGSAADGVTVHVPVQVLNQVVDEGFDWQVPGVRGELATALIRSLPKATRVHFVPAPDHAMAALAEAQPGGGRRLTAELARVLSARTGHPVAAADFAPERVPDHLRITFSVEDDRGRPLGSGKDLGALQAGLAGQVQRRMSRVGSSVERKGLRQWDFGPLPETFETESGGQIVHGFPALVDRGDGVDLVVMPSEREARAATALGVRRLLLLNTSAPWKRVLARLSNAQKLALGDNPHGSVPALLEDCLACAVDAIVAEHAAGGVVRDPAEFEQVLGDVRTHVASRVLTVVDAVEPVLSEARQVRAALDRLTAPAAAAMVADVRAQLDSLVYAGFVADTGLAHLPHLRRYLRGMLQRLEKAPSSPASLARDAVSQEVVDRMELAYADLLDSLPRVDRRSAPVREIGWMVEELRVSLFANSLGTAYPVSEKRIRAAIAAVR
jgi:ATP-dependent helicase HrpA